MKQVAPLVALLAPDVAAMGSANRSEDVAAAYVSPLQYQQYSGSVSGRGFSYFAESSGACRRSRQKENRRQDRYDIGCQSCSGLPPSW